jgi:hypothetical protein
MKPKVVATSWHPGGANAIVPVITRLKEECQIELITIGHEYSEKIFTDAGLNYRKISDYGLKDVSASAMENLLRKESPNLVLTGTSAQDEKNRNIIEQTITLAAKNQSIQTLSVLDFWGNYSLRFDNIYTGEHFKFLPDKIAIMDIYAEKDMLAEGFDKSKLVITGNPHFDTLESKANHFTKKQKKILRESFGLNKNIILFYAANAWKKDKEAYGYWDLDNITLINETLREVAEQGNNGADVIVKLHPRTPDDDIREINQYLSKNAKNMAVVKNIDTQAVVLATDLTLTPTSTVGIEAVYMKKPCISLQPGLKCQDFLSILTKNSIIPIGYTSQECKSLVKKAITDTNYREKELIEKASSFRTDGRATERVTDLVYEMLAQE